MLKREDYLKLIKLLAGLLVLLLVVALVTKCGKSDGNSDTKTEATKTPATTDASSEGQNGNSSTYSFVDVHGKSYEAELLDSVPKNKLDWNNLKTENNLKYYSTSGDLKKSPIGIDVSRYQGTIDWKKVKAAGIDFVILRIGYRGYAKDGLIARDDMFDTNIKGAQEAGLEVGVYFFSQAINDKEALEEALFVTDILKDYKITYPVVFDTEELIVEDGARTEGLSKEVFTDNCIAFCNAVKEKGYRPMIYANMKWMAFTLDLTKLTDFEIWYADYEEVPQNPYEFSMWQYTESATIDGIDAPVDVNIDLSSFLSN